MSKTQPALLGGLALGVLSALPVIGLGNCCCGAWILMGGGLAAYLLQQENPNPIDFGDGAIVGLLAGVFGAIAFVIVSIPINTMLAGFQASVFQRMMSNANEMPPEAREFFERLSAQRAVGLGIGAVFFFFVSLFVCAFWSMVGGLFGTMMFRKTAPPPIPPIPPQFPTDIPA